MKALSKGAGYIQWVVVYNNVLELLHSVLESTEEGLAAVYVGSPHLDHSGTEEGAIFATEHAKPPSMAPGGTEKEYWLAMCIEVSSCLIGFRTATLLQAAF